MAGKLGDKQLITVFGDAPDENKESEEAETCEADDRQLYFRAVGEPEGWEFTHFDQIKKDRIKTVLVEVAGLEPTVSSTRNWRDTNFATPR